MIDALKELYEASLHTQGHAAFYRLPYQNSFHGCISSTIIDASDEVEGFIIRPFEPNHKPKVIPNEIYFSYETELKLNVRQQNEFTDAFLLYYRGNPKKATPSAFYQSKNISFSTRMAYLENIVKAQQEIGLGHFKKTVLSRVAKFHYTQTPDVMDLFFALSAKYPNAFISLISSPFWGTWLGASPEILLQQSAENYITVALAGTKKTSTGSLFTSKEEEEQNIIKESIEHTLASHHIQSHSSQRENFDTGGLTHLKTTIAFKAPGGSRLNLSEELHPTPAVGGFPRKEAVHFILQNENYAREIYAGYIGPIHKNSLSLFVHIRCMQWLPDYALLYAGAGITSGSEAEAEWEETENKMKIISDVL